MYKELTIEEITEKYREIEDKIPSIWSDYPTAGKELAQDILYHWDISEAELIRVISLLEIRVSWLRISQHINPNFAVYGEISPEMVKMMNDIYDERKDMRTQINILKNSTYGAFGKNPCDEQKMEKIQKLIKLCDEHNVKIYEGSSNSEYYVPSEKYFYLNDIPYKLKEKFSKIIIDHLSMDYDNNFKFYIDTKELKMISWFTDHHTGSKSDWESVNIPLNEEQKEMLITYFENCLEYQFKEMLKKVIIQELVDRRYSSLITNFEHYTK